MTKSETKKLDKYYMTKYGITYRLYCAMAKNGCWLCGKMPKPGQRRLAVDHDHARKEPHYRGILCFMCNHRRVGRLTSDWAFKIYNYLKKAGS